MKGSAGHLNTGKGVLNGFLLVRMRVVMGTANKEKTRQPVLHRLASGAGRHEPPRCFLYKENHRQCRWYQKALAMPRKNIRAKRGTSLESGR